MRIGLSSLVLALLVVLIPTGASAAGGDISYSCSPAPANCAGWYKVAVTVHFSITPNAGNSLSNIVGCGDFTVSSDTTGVSQQCSATVSDGTTSTTLSTTANVKKDGTPPVISGITARGPDANGWYNHPLSIGVNASDATSGLASCNSTTYAGPDTTSGSFTGTCSDNAGNSASGGSFGFKYDATRPSVSMSLSRGPDSNGWYNHPVDFSASGSDNLSGIASCSSGTFGGGSSVSASCTDNAGNTGSAGAGINYDASAPSIDNVTLDRAPDSDGWYNHPVRVTFHGSDGGSGIDSCTDVSYSGPDTTGTTVNGTCTDKAGNRSGGTSPSFKYDSTPPTLSNLGVDWDDGSATLTWTASADTKSIEIDRTPGPDGPDAGAVFKGLASSFEDKGLTNKVKYLYTISAFDDAGNKAVESVTIIPAAKLYSPARGTAVTSPPLLGWRKVPGASYYNLQVYFGGAGKALRRVASLNVSGRKVLSAWPLKPHYRMKKSWKYKGKTRNLVVGHYRWYVYPGIGKRSANKYGPLIGQSDFYVKKK
jgi:hypothetical protein